MGTSLRFVIVSANDVQKWFGTPCSALRLSRCRVSSMARGLKDSAPACPGVEVAEDETEAVEKRGGRRYLVCARG